MGWLRKMSRDCRPRGGWHPERRRKRGTDELDVATRAPHAACDLARDRGTVWPSTEGAAGGRGEPTFVQRVRISCSVRFTVLPGLLPRTSKRRLMTLSISISYDWIYREECGGVGKANDGQRRGGRRCNRNHNISWPRQRARLSRGRLPTPPMLRKMPPIQGGMTVLCGPDSAAHHPGMPRTACRREAVFGPAPAAPKEWSQG